MAKLRLGDDLVYSVSVSPDAAGFGQAARVLCLDWSETGLFGGTSSGYIFRLPSGQGDWQPLHRVKASPVYSLGQAPGQVNAAALDTDQPDACGVGVGLGDLVRDAGEAALDRVGVED